MKDTKTVFECPRHGLLHRHQVRSLRCKLCDAPVRIEHMRVELVEFDRQVSALRPRPRKVVHHAHS